MENIAPPLILLWDVRRSLEKGHSVSTGIKSFLIRRKSGNFHDQIENWWAAQNNPQILYNKCGMNYKRQFLLETLELGLKGHAILQTLQSIETELILSCEDEIQRHVTLLPLISLIPMMLLVFPAVMIVLVSPLIKLLPF